MDWRVVKFLTRFQYRKAEERETTAARRARVEAAARDGRDLDILYLKTDDTKTRRRIRPLAVEMMEFKGRSFEGVRAWCRLRGEERVFRVDRMLEVEAAPEDGSTPDEALSGQALPPSTAAAPGRQLRKRASASAALHSGGGSRHRSPRPSSPTK